jgi:hypothetical protein
MNIIKNVDKIPNLCKNCKYIKYFANMHYSKCTKFGRIDLVSGDIRYDYASTAREFTCKGKYYEEKETFSTKIISIYKNAITK